MSDKPIYIDRGNGSFERFPGSIADLQMPGWPEFFPGVLPTGTVTAVCAAADHVYNNEQAPADLMALKRPTPETWAALNLFLELERDREGSA